MTVNLYGIKTVSKLSNVLLTHTQTFLISIIYNSTANVYVWILNLHLQIACSWWTSLYLYVFDNFPMPGSTEFILPIGIVCHKRNIFVGSRLHLNPKTLLQIHLCVFLWILRPIRLYFTVYFFVILFKKSPILSLFQEKEVEKSQRFGVGIYSL